MVSEQAVALQKELGKVESVVFGREDHGILTCFVHLDFGGSRQGFGGYVLDTFCERRDRRVGSAAGTDFVLRLLDLFGVDRLDQIKGRVCYALREKAYGQIVGLETTPFEGGKRFLVEEWRAEWFPQGASND
jgi:hypothetical protein